MVLLQMPARGGFGSWQEAEGDPGTVGEVADAVGCLRTILGERWMGWAKSAPLANVFTISFQEGPREWVRLQRLVRDLEGVPGRDRVVRRDLGSPEWTQYMAAVMALEFCGRLRRSGRRAEFIQNTDAKSPDARIDLAGRWVTVEFKAMHEPDEMKAWNELHDLAFEYLARHGLDLGGLEVNCEQGAVEPGVRSAFLDGLLAVKQSGSTDRVELPAQSGRARNIPCNVGRWRFPVEEVPDIERIVRKMLGKWRRQLAKEPGPTVLVVRTGALFGEALGAVVSNAEAAARSLAAAAQRLPSVAAVVVYDEMFWQPPAPAFLGVSSYRLSIGAADGCARAALLVPNGAAAVPLTPAELDSLVRPDMLW
jgi:hypothetical protein